VVGRERRPARQEIAAFIPGTKHGTREVFEEKVLVGCEDTGAMEAMMEMGMDEDARRRGLPRDPRRRRVGRHRRRLHRDAGAHHANPEGIGVFGLAFYENNTDKLQVATMSGIEPTVDTIATGEYPVSRPLFFYIKKAHLGVIPGLRNTPSSSSPTTSQAPSARWPPTASSPTRNWPTPRPSSPTASPWAATCNRAFG
jgi:phosphate transport system substrate-binding protein